MIHLSAKQNSGDCPNDFIKKSLPLFGFSGGTEGGIPVAGEVTVYVDLLLFVNAVVNSTLLYIAYKIIGKKIPPLRFFLAAALSTLYGLVVCLPAFSFTLNIFFKTAAAALICLIAFDFGGVRVYLKNLAIFLLVSFGYVGLITAFQYLPLASSSFYMNNGEIYYNLPLPYLLIMGGALCLLQKIISDFYRRRTSPGELFDCLVCLGENQITVPCLYDSGNFLRETLSGLPVAVMERSALKALLPAGSEKSEDLFDLLSRDPVFCGRVFLVPFKGAGGSGLFTGFRPDRFSVSGNEKKVIIALSNGKLDRSGKYRGIIGRECV